MRIEADPRIAAASATVVRLVEPERDTYDHRAAHAELGALSAAAVAHEVLSAVAGPLVAIRAALGPGSMLRPRHRELLERAEMELAELSTVVDGLLACAVDGGVPKVSARTVDLVPIVRQVSDDPVWSRDHLVRFSSSGECFACVDPPLIKRAVANLLSNATSYAPPGTAVDVRVDTADGLALVSVSDEGPGLRPDQTERVFDPGTRFSQAREGHGVGLFVVRSILQAHGGYAWAAGRAVRGATFNLAVPTPDRTTNAGG